MAIIIGAGGLADRASIPLGTRRGNFIPNERRLERNPAALRAAVEFWNKEQPNARLRSATSVYNCMGLIFACRRAWIDTEHLAAILTGDEYRRLAGPGETQSGDVVVYREKRGQRVCHVGVVLTVEPEINTASRRIRVMSQWGADGEYIHFIEDVPEILGEPVEYWTERRPKP